MLLIIFIAMSFLGCWLILLFIASLISTLPSLLTTKTVFFSVRTILPVTTRSMAKGGLKVNTTFAPPPSNHPTCSNTISDMLESSTTVNNVSLNDQLPVLMHPSNATPSSSERDSDSETTVDSDFETSKFENFKSPHTMPLQIFSPSNSSQFFNMESNCKEEVVSTAPSFSVSSSNDEILKILTAISSQMVVGHQDLQSQLVSNNLHLTEELKRVREEHEKFKQKIHAELSSTSSLPSTPLPLAPSVTLPPLPTMTLSASPGDSTNGSTSADFQSQMLAVLNDTFSKLSSVISDTSTIL
jgi:hypothetical protein